MKMWQPSLFNYIISMLFGESRPVQTPYEKFHLMNHERQMADFQGRIMNVSSLLSWLVYHDVEHKEAKNTANNLVSAHHIRHSR